tara:strand:- start:284 stop:427 length:144 start_codon:yes stop_codon:yes gene_type:complete
MAIGKALLVSGKGIELSSFILLSPYKIKLGNIITISKLIKIKKYIFI